MVDGSRRLNVQMPIRVTQFLHTDTGAVRSHNEDGLLALPDRKLWVVCDGMGGHDAGDYASSHIISRLRHIRVSRAAGSRIRDIERSLGDSNAHLLEYTRAQGLNCVGSTVVALVLDRDRATVLWVGDSRAYRLRDHRLRLISRDHSVAEEYAERGVPVEEGYSGAITRAVGVIPELEIDMISSQTRPGDVWLLCSDGVYGSLQDQAMAQIMRDSDDPARDLVELAIEQGSSDNCTAIVLRLDQG
ncbi:MAG: PP2C family protein-serine/threonine phosphatase [Wenzhouxiangella sp.]